MKQDQELDKELNRFWLWSKKNEYEYSQENGNGEWEMEYPFWDELYNSVDLTINLLNIKFNNKMADNLSIALAIDNESELVLEKIQFNLKSKTDFIKRALNSGQPQAIWQIAELLGKINFDTKESTLITIIESETNKYVIRRALLSLNNVNSEKAIQISKKYLNDSDKNLAMVAKKIKNKVQH